VKVFPREVMAWVGGFYGRAFAGASVSDGATFALRENDYVWGHRKFGGNAQRMSSARLP
jgi:lipoate-protein ligase A